MARDFAKGGQKGRRRKPARGRSPAAGGGWRTFAMGLLSGIFLSFLAYLASLRVPPEAVEGDAGTAAAQPPAPVPRFDFYERLEEQTIEVDVEPREVEPAREAGDPPGAGGREDLYLLQAGSFRQREDADRRRAELLLLGLDPSIEASGGDNGNWYRVYLGPFRSRTEMNRVRGLAAGQDIETLMLRRPHR